MPTEMLVISKADLQELTEQIKVLNQNFANITGLKKEQSYLTRKQVEEHYDLSKQEVAKIFNYVIKDKVIKLGKTQKIAKEHIDNLFNEGVRR